MIFTVHIPVTVKAAAMASCSTSAEVRVEAASHFDAAQAVGDLLSRLLCPKCTPPFTAGCDWHPIYEHTCGKEAVDG